MVSPSTPARITAYATAVETAIRDGVAAMAALRQLAAVHGLSEDEVRAAHCLVAATMLLAAAEAGAVGADAARHIEGCMAMLRMGGWSPQ